MENAISNSRPLRKIRCFWKQWVSQKWINFLHQLYISIFNLNFNFKINVLN